MAKHTTIGEIRAPQVVGMFGPGSIVNLEKLSVMPRGVSDWPVGTARLQSPTFARQIGAKTLIDMSALTKTGIPVSLFPQQFICRQCNTIQLKLRIHEDDLKKGFRCYRDSGPLYPSRWIRYCENGHIDDFDYRYFVHRDGGCDGRLTLQTGSSLADTWVRCECGASASMRDAYGVAAPIAKCSGRAPWLRSNEICDTRLKVSMRSASDVYFAAIRSGIAIEPESDPNIANLFEKLSDAADSVLSSEHSALEFLRLQKSLQTLGDAELLRGVREFFVAINTPVAYKDRARQEFNALARTCGSPTDDLYVEQLDAAGLRSYGLDGVFAVRKLREIRALVGFRRGGMPADPAFDDVENVDQMPTVGPPGEFPAYENRGEGIFLTFDRVWLENWLSRAAVERKLETFREAEEKWRRSSNRPGASRSRGIYILAHTFAHLMIRQLSLVSGYSQSSLRERIYASHDDSEPWGGFLIYTASSDADGSLGGLVAVATDGRLPDMVQGAMDSLRICSSDPVCALQAPHGFRKMNGAACHSCVVLPETCCERNNYFLDRTLAVRDTLIDESQALCFSQPLSTK